MSLRLLQLHDLVLVLLIALAVVQQEPLDALNLKMSLALSFQHQHFADKILHVMFVCIISSMEYISVETVFAGTFFCGPWKKPQKSHILEPAKLFCHMVEVIMQKYM